jgi:hypothetical protein
MLQILYECKYHKPSQNLFYITKITIPATTEGMRLRAKYCQLECEPKASHIRITSCILILQLVKCNNAPLSLFTQIKAGALNLKITNKIIRTCI